MTIENSEKIAEDMNRYVFIDIEIPQPNKHKITNRDVQIKKNIDMSSYVY